VPAGRFDGTRGWLDNTPARARYRDRSAKDAGGIARATIKSGRRLRLRAWGLPDALLDALAADDTKPLRLAIAIVNGGDSSRSCRVFAAMACRRQAGTRRHLVTCRGAASDGACGAVPTTSSSSTSTSTSTSTVVTTSTVTTTTSTTAPPAVCGNGVRESGEQCDGIPECSPTCTLPPLAAVSCCPGEGTCATTPAFSLNYYVYSYCTGFGFPGYVTGGVCDEVAGSCAVPVFSQPISACCEVATGCSDSAVPGRVSVSQSGRGEPLTFR
jgi:hypothetical protein